LKPNKASETAENRISKVVGPTCGSKVGLEKNIFSEYGSTPRECTDPKRYIHKGVKFGKRPPEKQFAKCENLDWTSQKRLKNDQSHKLEIFSAEVTSAKKDTFVLRENWLLKTTLLQALALFGWEVEMLRQRFASAKKQNGTAGRRRRKKSSFQTRAQIVSKRPRK
jgi:hypothetical protein